MRSTAALVPVCASSHCDGTLFLQHNKKLAATVKEHLLARKADITIVFCHQITLTPDCMLQQVNTYRHMLLSNWDNNNACIYLDIKSLWYTTDIVSTYSAGPRGF